MRRFFAWLRSLFRRKRVVVKVPVDGHGIPYAIGNRSQRRVMLKRVTKYQRVMTKRGL